MRRTTLIGSSLIVLSLAFAPLTDALRYDGPREHLQKEQFVRSVAAPSERLGPTACVEGRAGPFPCSGIDLLSFVPDDEMFTKGVQALGGGLSDIWGWTSEAGEDYVFFGKTNGTAFYRVTDPTDPVYLGEVPNPGPAELIWHDIKVNDGYAYIVSETPGHGVQVVDLSILDSLPGVSPGSVPLPIPQVGHYTLDGTAHNIVIDEESDTVYLVGSGQVLGLGGACTTSGKATDNAGLHAIDISVPNAPVYEGCHVTEGYVHDAHCATYAGPDEEHQGKQICVTSHEDGVAIVDVTDINDAKTLSDTASAPNAKELYPGVEYSHQGWMSEDQRFYFHGDELDENGNQPTRTFIFDIQDLDAIALYEAYEHRALPGEKHAKNGFRVNIDHNMYTHQGLLYQSDYEAGLRVFDYTEVGSVLADGSKGTLQEVAHFDTYPESNRAAFNGTWSNYPYFENGTIAVTGIGEGLFLVKLQDGIIPATAG